MFTIGSYGQQKTSSTRPEFYEGSVFRGIEKGISKEKAGENSPAKEKIRRLNV